MRMMVLLLHVGVNSSSKQYSLYMHSTAIGGGWLGGFRVVQLVVVWVTNGWISRWMDGWLGEGD